MSATFSYDLLEYPSHVHPQAHPSRLAAIGRLHGLDVASPTSCRLLEIGCGDGMQLLALAMAYPSSQFTGIDLSHAAISRGEALRKALGLGNLQLVAADLAEWDPGRGGFDFIVAHGFYSWVPDCVRERLLALCRQALSPHGIAYVSYNALPGCHLRRLMWDMLRHHTRSIQDPRERIAAACDLLENLESDVAGSKIYGELIRGEARDLLRRTDRSVLFHDDLADTNQPFSITEFATRARSSGLRYLAEADYHEMSDACLAPAARERLAAWAGGDRLEREQYLDFLKGRRFRQTLLCHAEAPLHEVPDSASVRGLHAVGHLRLEAPANGTLDLTNGVAACFTSGDGAALTTDHPVLKAALAIVGNAFPGAPGFEDVLATARDACQSRDPLEADAEAMARGWLSAFELGLVTLHCDPPVFALEAGAFPRASLLARLQLASGSDLVTSLRPSMVRLESELAIELIRLLDGSRDRAALRRDLAARMVERQLLAEDQDAHDAAWWEAQLDGMLEDGLRQSARMALLVA